MRVTQGAFSFLPDLTDEQIAKQVAYCLDKGWAVSIEFTDDIHPRNTFWEMWAQPMFDLRDPAGVMLEIRACRDANPNVYIRVNGFDSGRFWEAVRHSFIVQRPKYEPGFALERTKGKGRTTHYQIRPYATEQPEGERYTNGKTERRA
ncbi:MAG: ribulose bisphosphate carboxylase small subunit [Pseudomonadota bacterium]|nr:ribulose bisphosphate carboxylase small subunit [Pseudomonadota bacterium]